MRAETRHQLKQDAFSRVTFDAAEKTADWTVAHRTTLIVSAVAVAIVLAAVVGGWYYLSAQDEKASFDLSLAVRTLDTQLRPAGTPAQPDVPSFTSAKERAEAAQKKFQAIVDKYPHTRTADLAHYFLGVTAADLLDNATAERNFKQVASVRQSRGCGRGQSRPGFALRSNEPHETSRGPLSGTHQQAHRFRQQSHGAAAVGRTLPKFQPAARCQENL